MKNFQVRHSHCVDGITSIVTLQSDTIYSIYIAKRCFYIVWLNNYMFRPLYRPSSGCKFSYYQANYTIYNIYIPGSVHRNSRLKKSNEMQQYEDIYLLLNYSTCFGRPSRPCTPDDGRDERPKHVE